MKLKSLLTYAALLMTAPLFTQAQAEDDASTNSDLTWDLTVELSAHAGSNFIVGSEPEDVDHYFSQSLWVNLYYKGFFIQTNGNRFNSGTSDGEMGYQLVLEPDYEIDLIHKVYLTGFSDEHAGLIWDEPIPELQGIKARDDSAAQGIRYWGEQANSVYWIDVAADVFGISHKGWVVEGFYSYLVEKSNWNIYFGVGASFFSSKLTDYMFGVDPDEVAVNRPVYHTGSGYRIEMETYADYPLAENWLFTAGVSFAHYSSSIAQSPLVKESTLTRFKVGVSYVF